MPGLVDGSPQCRPCSQRASGAGLHLCCHLCPPGNAAAENCPHYVPICPAEPWECPLCPSRFCPRGSKFATCEGRVRPRNVLLASGRVWETGDLGFCWGSVRFGRPKHRQGPRKVVRDPLMLQVWAVWIELIALALPSCRLKGPTRPPGADARNKTASPGRPQGTNGA